MPAELTLAEIKALALIKLNGSGLDADDYKTLQLTPTGRQAARGAGLASAEGFRIPYFTKAGKPTKFFRYRLVVDTRSGFEKLAGKKLLRYLQPPRTDVEAYYPPLLDWEEISADVTQPVIITEGELKAAAATKLGFPTIGLGGVYSFQSNKNSQLLVPSLADFGWADRTVYIVYDSDAATNPNVIAAEQRLAERLTAEGASVYISRLPAHEELSKCGLDDYLVLHGAEALTALLGSDRTYEYSGSAVLHNLSERVVYVRNPGLIWDHRNQMRMSPADFTGHAYSNVHYLATTMQKGGVEVKTKQPAAKAWLNWEARAEAKALAFSPGAPRITEGGDLNTWTAWGVDAPLPGDVSQWHLLLGHIFGADVVTRTWFERWAAYPLQHPGAKLATSMAVWGTVHGSGKTLIGHTLMRIYGKHAVELKDTDLEDDRNEWAEGKCFALCDDITAKGDRKFMRRLMTMVTQKWIRLNPKYIPSYSVPDLINYYYTSNDPDALYMDDQDRRFCIFETTAGKFLPFKAYCDWRDSDSGIAALWHYLLELDLGDFDPQAPAPTSSAKAEMIEVGKSELGAWVHEFKRNGDHILAAAGMKGDLFSMKQLHALYDPAGAKRTSVNALAREFKREGFRPAAKGAPIKLTDGYQVVVWAVRNAEHWLGKAAWGDVRKHYEDNNLIVKRKF
jgi:hypothetical protein